MTTQEIADRLVGLCRQGKNMEAIETLYAEDIHSIEPVGEEPEAKGLDAIRGKATYFEKSMEVHSAKVSDPIVAADHFSISYYMDVTNKENGQRYDMAEIAVYQVKDGKIVREQFFYSSPG